MPFWKKFWWDEAKELERKLRIAGCYLKREGGKIEDRAIIHYKLGNGAPGSDRDRSGVLAWVVSSEVGSPDTGQTLPA